MNVENGTGAGLPKRGSVSFNGFAAGHCLVLVNGIRIMSDHVHTGQNIELVPAEEIERIEIIRSSASAQYGSDALGGIINIVTRKPGVLPAASVKMEAGSYDTYHGSLYLSTKASEKVSVGNHIDWIQSHGIPITKPTSRVGQMGYTRMAFNQRVLAAISEKTDLDVDLRAVKNTMRSNNVLYSSTLLIPSLHISSRINDKANLSGRVGYTDWQGELNTEKNQLLYAEFFLRHTLGKKNTILGGMDYHYNIFSRKGVEQHEQARGALFVEFERRCTDQFSVVLSARGEYHENLNPIVVPKISLAWHPSEKLNVRGIYGFGYHAPTVQEKYELAFGHSGSALRFGNPDLKPEHSQTAGISIDYYPFRNFRLYGAGFYSIVENFIVPVYEGPWEENPSKNIWRRNNILRAEIMNFEGGVQYYFAKHYHVEGGYSWADNTSSSAEQQLPYKPGSSFKAKISGKQVIKKDFVIREYVQMNMVYGRSAWNWKPAATAIQTDPYGMITPLADYSKLDAGIVFQIKEKIDISFRISNILGEDIELLDDAFMVITGEPNYTFGIKMLF
jgi:outer membrane cobalamin receptor